MLDQYGIRLGDVLVIVSFVGTAIGFLRSYDKSEAHRDFVMQRLTSDVENLQKEVSAQSRTLNEIATQRKEIDLLMKWYDELRRGVGIVREFPHDG